MKDGKRLESIGRSKYRPYLMLFNDAHAPTVTYIVSEGFVSYDVYGERGSL